VKDAGGPLYPTQLVDAFDYKGLRVGFCRGPRSPETIFQSNTLRPMIKIAVAGAWCDLEIHKLDSYYRYNLRVDGRAYFSRFVLVQGDQCELLTLAQVSELKAKKFVPMVLPAGLDGLTTYLDTLVEYKVNKEKQLDAIEGDICMRLLNAGMTISG
jgi:hypothetical protein